MTPIAADRLDRAIAGLPQAFPGPGGALAVLREGRVLARHAWGFANAERRIPFTPATLFRVCSITKQFTCATVLEHFPDPAALDGDVRRQLPRLEGAAPSARQLMHNQSGLRDYWAVAMLHGAPAESPFGAPEAARVIAGTGTLQFRPGTRFSYVNQNFRILSDVLEQRTGRGFAELLRGGILARAGMTTAQLVADTEAMPDGTEGYEGTQDGGFRPAENRILWTGDAGLVASLDDLIAWERHLDATRDDAGALASRIAAPVAFLDGTPAWYGFGLARGREFGRALAGHGGGLRGWRSHRLYVPAERLSVVVLFNHLADAQAASRQLLAAALGEVPDAPRRELPPPPWLGTHRDPETGLAVRIALAEPGRVRLLYGHSAELLDLCPDGSAGQERTRLRATPDGLVMERPAENLATRLIAVAGTADPGGLAGTYRSAELDAEILIADAGGTLFGGFSGFLGQGRMEQLQPLGTDLWLLPCHRALDYAPPGDWTLAFRRDASGRVGSVQVGCWLARGLVYHR